MKVSDSPPTLISYANVASHAGAFRGARFWGGEKYELP